MSEALAEPCVSLISASPVEVPGGLKPMIINQTMQEGLHMADRQIPKNRRCLTKQTMPDQINQRQQPARASQLKPSQRLNKICERPRGGARSFATDDHARSNPGLTSRPLGCRVANAGGPSSYGGGGVPGPRRGWSTRALDCTGL